MKMSVCDRLEKQLTGSLDWNDTFLNIDHLKSSFPGYTVRVKTDNPTVEPHPPFRWITNQLKWFQLRTLQLLILCLVFTARQHSSSYAKRCISYDRFCLTVWPSVTVRYHAKMTPATIMRSSLEDSPMILVSWRLTSPRNSKGNIGREGAEWERGRKNVAKIGNF